MPHKPARVPQVMVSVTSESLMISLSCWASREATPRLWCSVTAEWEVLTQKGIFLPQLNGSWM